MALENKAWDELMIALHDVQNVEQAVAAARTLQSTASAEDVPRLISLLTDENFFVREAAAWPLSDMGRTEALPEMVRAHLAGAAEGHDNDGLSAAMIDLVQMNSVTARPVLQALLDSEDEGSLEVVTWLLAFCEPGASSN